MSLSVRDKHIQIPATQEGFREAANWLMRWRSKILRNAEKLLDKMLKEGENYAFLGAAAHIYTGLTIDTIMSYRDGNHGVLLVGGNAIWVEFGTGVYAQGQTDHPVLNEVAQYGIVRHGEYGDRHGSDPNGWYYTGDDGQVHHTYGIPSDPFFYNTAQELRRQYDKYAKEIFKK